MNKSSLAPTASHAKYMDFIAPKKKPLPAGRPTSEVHHKTTKPAPKPVSKPTSVKPVEKSVQKSVSTPAKAPAKAPAKPAVKAKDEAPDAAKYTLGGKSPFLTSVTVEKRPLSSSVPDAPAKNIYPDKPSAPSPEPAQPKPTRIIKKKQKSSGGLSFVIILLTILLGAIVGVAAYYLLPN